MKLIVRGWRDLQLKRRHQPVMSIPFRKWKQAPGRHPFVASVILHRESGWNWHLSNAIKIISYSVLECSSPSRNH